MPENQSQPRTEGLNNPQGSPSVSAQPPQADEGPIARPSDTEAAHAPQEGQPGYEADAEGRIEGAGQPGPDRRADYGGGNMGHSRPGTDAQTAGAEFADRLPEASSTPAVEGDTPGTKKSPTS